MHNKLFLFTAVLLVNTLVAQNKSNNLVIVTLDGMRWQEVFNGADKALLGNKAFTKDSSGTWGRFWQEDLNERRKKLFPFLWSTVEKQGRLYGNRAYDNKVNVTNNYWFSYPGYNEIFTGYPDDSVNSNHKNPNINENVLEFLNKQKDFNGKIAAFTTWDVFPYILNKQRSNIYVNADVDTFRFASETFQLLNDWQFLTPKPIGVRPDVITYIAAREYMKKFKPRVLYIAFDETDDWAHGGEYDQYLSSAYSEDRMLADLWNYIQSDPGYKNNTTLLITCDHGRGDKIKEDWRHHGKKTEGSDQIWFAVIGPGIEPKGEIKTQGQYYQKQFAATIARLVGHTFTANHPVAEPMTELVSKTPN
jgi:hypothetical protein